MKRVPEWVEDFIAENTDNEEDAMTLYDYADCLINDEGFGDDVLEMCLEEHVQCLNGTCEHYTCTEGQSLADWENSR